jgi:hypothetical protein
LVRTINLKRKLNGAFLIMGLIVLAVALAGWSGNSRLTQHISTLTNNTLPSVIGLWKISDGHSQVQSAELTILNPRTKPEIREAQFSHIEKAWEQIEAGFKEYQAPARNESENKRYQRFIQDWETWKQAHEEFMQMYKDFQKFGIPRPITRQAELLRLGLVNSPEMAATKAASALIDKINNQSFDKKNPAFIAANASLQELLAVKGQIALAAKQATDRDVVNTSFWVFLGVIIGPLTALIFGIFLTNALIEPLKGVVNIIANSSAQIAAAIEEQERIASEQAASCVQCTAAMRELGASSKVAAEQASVLAAGTMRALTLTEEGNKAVGRTLEGMAALQQKVGAIAESIRRLSQQAGQIGNISVTVSALANQTNMLALNAAVEAVRAGDHGRGFAVVASEIRKLADQSKKSADKINDIVAEIQRAVDLTVRVTNEGNLTVAEGVKIARETAEAFTGVAAAIDRVVASNKEIALTAKQQAVSIQQVIAAMNYISTGAQQAAGGITQTKQGTQKLNQAAQNLKLLGIG